MDKKEIARVFEEIALLLEMRGDNPFRVRAYRSGARALLNTEEPLSLLVKEKRLTDLEGIGEDLAEKIETLFKKGRLPFYEKLKRATPRALLEMRRVRGLGAKKIKVLYEKCAIRSLAGLKRACEKGEVSALPGFGKKTEQNILDALSQTKKNEKRHLFWDAMERAHPLLEALRRCKGVQRAEIAGSLRRGLETIGDIDLVASASDPTSVATWFASQPEVERVIATGEAKSSVRLKGGIHVDLLIVPEKEFGFALCHFTGSKEHNIKLREKARNKGWSLSEHGFIPIGKRRAPSLLDGSETSLYKALGYPYIPPELREDRGEFEAAKAGKLPTLIEEREIRGTFHNHTTASDGESTLKEMALAAQEMGWEYLGISDHSKSSFQANGLSGERLLQQIEQIHALNASKELALFLFAGTECDILPNGSLDFPDTILKKLDFVIASVHSAFSQDEKKMTQRIIKAIEHPLTTMIGHLSGRLLLKRAPYAVDIPKVIDACIANKKIIELNGNPERLDMDWRFWRSASEKGLLCCINTDAHSTTDHLFLRAGVTAARKGWLQRKNVFNTRSLAQVRTFFKRA